MSSLAPTAALAGACTPRLPGPSSAPWSRAHGSRRNRSGVSGGRLSRLALGLCLGACRGRCRRLRLLGLAALDREFELRLPAQLVRLALRLGLLPGRGFGGV